MPAPPVVGDGSIKEVKNHCERAICTDYVPEPTQTTTEPHDLWTGRVEGRVGLTGVKGPPHGSERPYIGVKGPSGSKMARVDKGAFESKGGPQR